VIYRMIDQAFEESYRPIEPITKPIDQAQFDQTIGSFEKVSKRISERLQEEGGPQRGPRIRHEQNEGTPGQTSPSANQPNQDHVSRSDPHAAQERPSFENRDPGGRLGSSEQRETVNGHQADNHLKKYASAARTKKLLQDLFKEKRVTPKEIETRIKHMTPDEIEVFLERLEPLVEHKSELEREKGTYLYPEWNDPAGRYQENWARIREHRLEGRSGAFYDQTIIRHAGLLKRIRREFQMLKPEELARLGRQLDGEEIDLDAAIEYFIDRKTGITPSEKHYIRIQRKQRDIAVAFLIDMSKSTKGATIAREKEALIIMSEALREVGDAFAIYGFSGDNRDNVDFYTIKDFEEDYNHRVKARISDIDYRFENRDGTAIRHTTSILRKREEKTKLLILLSDGKPVDKEYSGHYAIEDTRTALLEARTHGIRTFCVTVDKAAADYLPRMYSHSQWAVIDDVHKLPEKLSLTYRGLTR